MTIASHPVWPFEPNWVESVGETLEWLTDVLGAPSGAEQRRSMRYFPRRMFNYTIAVEGAERNLLDNLLMTHSAGDWYLPLWHDVTLTTAASSTTEIPCVPPTSIAVGTVIFIKGTTLFDYQVSEVTVVGVSSITVSPAISVISANTVIHPMTVARLTEQVTLSAMTDAVETAEPQFLVTVAPSNTDYDFADSGFADEYLTFPVLTLEPEWTNGIERGQTRLLDVIDNAIGVPEQADSAARPFPTQKHALILDGAAAHVQFYKLAQALRGRVNAAWIPTWMDDFRLALPVTVSSTTVVVQMCGYTLAGGPRPEREDVMIETVAGDRYYRRIVASEVSGANEELTLDVAVGPFALSELLRVCFISLMRLDHDTIEIEHITDGEGVSETSLLFRAAPDLRVPTAF